MNKKKKRKGEEEENEERKGEVEVKGVREGGRGERESLGKGIQQGEGEK